VNLSDCTGGDKAFGVARQACHKGWSTSTAGAGTLVYWFIFVVDIQVLI
jgi:hypothetical protein